MSAATNMAVDEALFRSALTRSSPPTVRFYAWARPSLSIGFGQSFHQVCDADVCDELGIEIVRRISGGRAILHHHELTYCVTAAAEVPLRGLSVKQVYSWVSGAIRDGLASLGIAVDPPTGDQKPLSDPSQVERPELPCLAVPTGHEVTVKGKKLVGSAQKWNRDGFLQHGSIIIDLDEALWQRATGLPPGTDLGAVGINHLLAGPIDRGLIAETLATHFERLFETPPSSNRLSETEMQMATRLADEKYSSPHWNRDRHAINI
jgi:lipoate-protein ligase A